MKVVCALALFFAACSPRGEHRLTKVSQSIVIQSSFNSPTREFYTYKATLPKGLDADNHWRPVAIGSDGRRYEYTTASYTKGTNDPSTLELHFETSYQAGIKQIVVGHYRIDVEHSKITDLNETR
jgi:hypothetical protein